MVKLPRFTSKEAEKMLLKDGFEIIRTKGSHKIYMKFKKRIVVPFHKGKTLHPKIVKQILKSINGKN
ncbi:MAG: type II toxin-antitoxin system HicA family toxin [Atribacterota bacterium]|nr:type II toxin-antitoxin system HicA family toxin [Atribacterota bacterium]MDD4765311.1 type II toxin-antitoxin system HicA family toxin [Atribacterota bacterium]MDD5635850.1 type II toxin-antitoxin system HicA family toxin [Atribacterota bacterium]MDI9596461.1 type II toxin-antitoxin system HicA family toxin [Atribacterota bacterium]